MVVRLRRVVHVELDLVERRPQRALDGDVDRRRAVVVATIVSSPISRPAVPERGRDRDRRERCVRAGCLDRDEFVARVSSCPESSAGFVTADAT
jgi:hypothetical protein